MKRDILFRGREWNADNEMLDFVYGYLTDYSVIKDEFGTSHVVHEETIGQFTGLLDKEGNRIFEGDKILYDEIEGIVLFKDSSFFVRFEYLRSLHLLGELGRDLEVIENIYES